MTRWNSYGSTHLVSINPMNRDEKLMSAAEMSAKGAKIVNVGASRDLCDCNRAWATQDDPVKRESWNWTVKTAAISDHFGKPSMSIAYGSIGCSHWNQFLHAVNTESPTSVESLKDRRGFIDKAKIFGNDKVFQEIASTGLQWSVIKKGFLDRFPLVPKLFSKALNTEHNIAVGETWDQQISSICSIAGSYEGDIAWSSLCKQITASQGAHIGDLGIHVQFVKKYGGGRTLSHIKSSLQYLNCRMPPHRKVSGQFIRNLTEVPLAADFQVPRLVQAAFRAHACCDEMHCDDHLARYITFPEVKSIGGKNREKALEAEQTLARLQQVLEASNRSAVIEYGDISVSILEAVIGKTDDSIKDPLDFRFPISDVRFPIIYTSSCACYSASIARLSIDHFRVPVSAISDTL